MHKIMRCFFDLFMGKSQKLSATLFCLFYNYLHNHSSRIRLSLVNDHFVKEDPGGDAVLATVCACKRRVMASGEAVLF